jgi:isoamylase
MVRRLHEAGIEVILDVVYNHTAEGNQMGPTLSFRGIDNASYYCWPTTRATISTRPAAATRSISAISACCRWSWIRCATGSRIATSTASASTSRARSAGTATASTTTSVFLDAVRQDPCCRGQADRRAVGHRARDGYQLGNFPPGWAEWNDRYRDDVRSFWKGDEGMRPARLAVCSARRSVREARPPPWASVNFVTAHDGFTLADLVSYNDKHNEANGEDNRDGHSHNLSWNCGVEGPTTTPRSSTCATGCAQSPWRRCCCRRARRCFLMGDEIGRTPGRQQQRLLPGQRDQLAASLCSPTIGKTRARVPWRSC